MAIDLDAPIYAVPCGVPGDLDALSGRAHICDDGTRLAVTTCVVVPDPCGCVPGTLPTTIAAHIDGVSPCPDWIFIDPVNGAHELIQDPYQLCYFFSPLIRMRYLDIPFWAYLSVSFHENGVHVDGYAVGYGGFFGLLLRLADRLMTAWLLTSM